MTITNPHLQDPTQSGWTYLHLVVSKNPLITPQRLYERGDPVVSGNRTFAEVNKYVGTRYPSHLHLEWGSGEDPTFKPYWLRPTKDPLDLLAPGGDKIVPIVEQIHFKSGETDDGGDSWGPGAPQGFETPSRKHRYFTSQDYAGNLVVGKLATTDSMDKSSLGGTDVIDIVGEIYDQFKTDGRKPGVKLVNINIQGKTIIGILHIDTSFVFKDEFTADSKLGGAQTNRSLTDPERVRTAYTVSAKFHDTYDQLEQTGNISRVAYVRNSFYTLTNFNNNQIIETSDKSRAWAPTTLGGTNNWNDPTLPRYTNNALSRDPDGYYDVKVNTADQAGNVGTKTRRILLDNWQQTVFAKSTNLTDGKVTITGANWTANSTVGIWFRRPTLQEGGAFNGDKGVKIGNAPTDADGNIIPVVYQLSQTPDKEGWIIYADYHNGGDNIYEPRLDALAIIQVPADPSRPTPAPFLADGGNVAGSDSGSSGGGGGRYDSPFPRPTSPANSADDRLSEKPALHMSLARPELDQPASTSDDLVSFVPSPFVVVPQTNEVGDRLAPDPAASADAV